MKNESVLCIIFAALLLFSSCIPLTLAVAGWNKTYGGAGDDEANSVIQTSDGGYAIVGFTNSSGAGGYDGWFVKTDAVGNIQWDKTFGGVLGDKLFAVVQTGDGGYVVAGVSNYSASSFVGSFADTWLIKTDSLGNVQWDKVFPDKGVPNSLFETADGGYTICTYWNLINTDSSGNVHWVKALYSARSATQTIDGGYAVIGDPWTQGNGTGLTKIDGSGQVQLNVTIEETEVVLGQSITQSPDGGYVVAGSIFGHEASRGVYPLLLWLAKANSSGNVQWSQEYQGPGQQNVVSGASCVIQSRDGGYALAGDASGSFWLLKADSRGHKQWEQTYARQGLSISMSNSLIQTGDSGYAIAGFTGNMSYSTHVMYPGDFWLVKTDENGATSGAGLVVASSTPIATTLQAPIWAFDGAYATYETAVNWSAATTGLQLNYTISNVNFAAQTFDLSVIYNGSLSNSSYSTSQVSFAQPSALPAMSSAEMALLNKGEFPVSASNSSGVQITIGVSVTVPGGTFITDEVNVTTSTSQGAVWVDMNTGLVVKASAGVTLSQGLATISVLQLVKTNVVSKAATNANDFFFDAAIVAVVGVILVLAAFSLVRLRKKGNNTKDQSPPKQVPSSF